MTRKPSPKKPSIKKSPATPMAVGADYYSPQGDMHTLKQAEQIRADPVRHKAAVMHAKNEVGALQKVARKKV